MTSWERMPRGVWKQAQDRTGQDRKRLAKEKVRKEVGQVGEAER